MLQPLNEEYYMDNKEEEKNEYKEFYPGLDEYNVGTSGGYGGMAGGGVAPNGWAGTPSSPQTSRRLKDYPAMRRYTYMNGNTVIGNSLYDTITKDDLTDPRFGPDEIMAGLRSEMRQLEYPDKDVARKTVIQNLEKNPKFYSDLDKYLKSDKLQETDMNQLDPKELEMGISAERDHEQDAPEMCKAGKDDRLAATIAARHLEEDPRYYSKLNAAGLGEGGTEETNVIVVGTTPQATATTAGQQPLTSSGLGKSGAPKPLTSPKTDAPETKIIKGNTIATTKTQPLNPNKESDPLNHFCGQIAGVMSQQGVEEGDVTDTLDKVRGIDHGNHWNVGHGKAGNEPSGPDTPPTELKRKSWDQLSPERKIYAADRKREREESPENRAIAQAEKATQLNNPHNKKPTADDQKSLRDKFLQYRKNKSA